MSGGQQQVKRRRSLRPSVMKGASWYLNVQAMPEKNHPEAGAGAAGAGLDEEHGHPPEQPLVNDDFFNSFEDDFDDDDLS